MTDSDAANDDRDEALAGLFESMEAAIARGETIDIGALALRHGVSLADAENAWAGWRALHDGVNESAEIAAESPEIPNLPADLRVLGELGRGGMGVVYRARQVSLDRDVAVKVLKPGELLFGHALKRFKKEATHLARLRHPNVVAIHEVGESGGQVWFTMDLIEGTTLAELAKSGRLTGRQIARILKETASALAYIHENGLVHRDLKPANILIDRAGRAFVTDFGLSLDIEGPDSLTRTGQILGTPAYMAPEQARGEHVAIGPATDVYALGAILYECLTGRPPFVEKNLVQTLHAVIHDPPKLPRSIRGSVPRDLEAIALKALEKEPHKRYAGALAFIADIERFESGAIVHAASPTAFDRAWRGIVRRRGSTVLVACIIIMAAWIMIERSRGRTMSGDVSASAAEELFTHGAFGAAAEHFRAAADRASDANQRAFLLSQYRKAARRHAGELLNEGRPADAVSLLLQAIAPEAAPQATSADGSLDIEDARRFGDEKAAIIDDLIVCAVAAGNEPLMNRLIDDRRAMSGTLTLQRLAASPDAHDDMFARVARYLVAPEPAQRRTALQALHADRPSWISAWGRSGLIDRLIELGDPAAPIIDQEIDAVTEEESKRQKSLRLLRARPLAPHVEMTLARVMRDARRPAAARRIAATILIDRIDLPTGASNAFATDEAFFGATDAIYSKVEGIAVNERPTELLRLACDCLARNETDVMVPCGVFRRITHSLMPLPKDAARFLENWDATESRLDLVERLRRIVGFEKRPTIDDIDDLIGLARKTTEIFVMGSALDLVEALAPEKMMRPIDAHRREMNYAVSAYAGAWNRFKSARPWRFEAAAFNVTDTGDIEAVAYDSASRRGLGEDVETMTLRQRLPRECAAGAFFGLPGVGPFSPTESTREIRIGMTMSTSEDGERRMATEFMSTVLDTYGSKSKRRPGWSSSHMQGSSTLFAGIVIPLNGFGGFGRTIVLVRADDGEADPIGGKLDDWRRRLDDDLRRAIERVSGDPTLAQGPDAWRRICDCAMMIGDRRHLPNLRIASALVGESRFRFDSAGLLQETISRIDEDRTKAREIPDNDRDDIRPRAAYWVDAARTFAVGIAGVILLIAAAFRSRHLQAAGGLAAGTGILSVIIVGDSVNPIAIPAAVSWLVTSIGIHTAFRGRYPGAASVAAVLAACAGLSAGMLSHLGADRAFVISNSLATILAISAWARLVYRATRRRSRSQFVALTIAIPAVAYTALGFAGLFIRMARGTESAAWPIHLPIEANIAAAAASAVFGVQLAAMTIFGVRPERPASMPLPEVNA